MFVLNSLLSALFLSASCSFALRSSTTEPHGSTYSEYDQLCGYFRANLSSIPPLNHVQTFVIAFNYTDDQFVSCFSEYFGLSCRTTSSGPLMGMGVIVDRILPANQTAHDLGSDWYQVCAGIESVSCIFESQSVSYNIESSFSIIVPVASSTGSNNQFQCCDNCSIIVYNVESPSSFDISPGDTIQIVELPSSVSLGPFPSVIGAKVEPSSYCWSFELPVDYCPGESSSSPSRP